MASQAPLRILCLDGGGVKGLSSLYVLKELMAQTQRDEKSRNRQRLRSILRPCDYFDLICGTGTGGILAIMLGRLQYDIETAIKAYVSLAEVVFETTSSEDRALFDAGTLEKEILKAIEASPDGSKNDALFEDPRVTSGTGSCRTFVLASRPEGLGKAAVRMRSYATEDSDPFQAKIWQVARATSAAPTYFLPIDINGIKYGDGRIGWNNPTMEAINETNCIWPGRLIGCVVSVGTGLEDALQLAAESKAVTISGVLGQLFRSLTPKQAHELAVAQYCVSCVTSCERVHGQVASSLAKFGIDGPWQYVRLNVPRGMAKIGLQEWKKFQMIAAMTEDYMEDIDIRELKRQVAQRLSSPEYYSFPTLASASVPNRGAMGVRGYTGPQRQIEARAVPTKYPVTAPNAQESGLSNGVIRQQQQLPVSRQQRGPIKLERSESSSDESGIGGQGETKRSKIDMQTGPSLVPTVANRGRLRHPPLTEFRSAPADINQTQHSSVTGLSKPASGDSEGRHQLLNGYVGELSATVLCCDYPDCRSMGPLQKDYLRDHYMTYHEESLVKPSMMVPPTRSGTQSRLLRCWACLHELADEDRKTTCDNCQRFTPIRDVATRVVPDQTGSEDAFTRPLRSVSQNATSLNNPSMSEMPPGLPSSIEAEGDPPPQLNLWTPPEIPKHWTSYAPASGSRANANTGYNRTRHSPSYKGPDDMPASVRRAREEYRRQRSYHENS